MTQISRNPVHKDVYYSIRDDLVWVFSELHSQEDTKVFFYEFFNEIYGFRIFFKLQPVD